MTALIDRWRKSQRGRIPELDGFRALLVFIVAWFHIWQQSWWTPRVGSVSLDFLVRAGYTMVDGTILLSGFLLFLPWARSMLRGDAVPDTVSFYRRRVGRIVPSYLVDEALLLFVVAIPLGKYASIPYLIKDLATHLTFTFTFWQDTYLGSPIGGACWTLAIEMQAYLLFPLLAKAMRKHPAATLATLCTAAFGFRAWCLWGMTDYSMVVNQLPAFLDVYALGILLSLVYVRLEGRPVKVRWRIGATLLFAAAVWAVVLLMKAQAGSQGFGNLQLGQMKRRFPLALALGAAMISLSFALKPLRVLFGNPVMHALAAVSMNFYLLHQPLAVQLKRWGIPASVSDTPNTAGEMPWQMQYTWLCFGLGLALAALLTFLVEKPAARGLKRLFRRWDERQAEKARQQAEVLRTALSGAELRFTGDGLDLTLHPADAGPWTDGCLLMAAEGCWLRLCPEDGAPWAILTPDGERRLRGVTARLNGRQIYAGGAFTDRRFLRLNGRRGR